MATLAPANPWTLVYEGYDPAAEGLREALCTLGNGRFATRGATPDGLHRTPGTYRAGCYDRLASRVAGRTVVNEDLVNLPDWLPLTFATPGSDWFHPDGAELLDYRQELDLRRGVLLRELAWRDDAGRVTRVRQRRLVSMADPALAALETTLTAENWSGPLRVRATLDGTVTNHGVARYRDLRGDHLTDHAAGDGDGLTWLTATTRSSRITAALAARIDAPVPGRPERDGGRIGTEHVPHLEEGVPVTVTKIVALVTSRDPASTTRARPRCAGPGRPPASGSCWPRTRPHGSGCGNGPGWRWAAPSWRSSCTCTSSTSCRRSARTPSTWTPACPPAACTARRTAVTCSGTSCSCCRG
ncbi:hypothetical protein [Nonomuraea bangladeshensis]|uniref:hypothetical protein n=1 Tax=Nonomuraea bangladeshensis TaxID=404385 RepID=UPI003C2B9657